MEKGTWEMPGGEVAMDGVKPASSELQAAANGVPQRSIWALIFFNIPTNDLCTKGRRLLIKPAGGSKEKPVMAAVEYQTEELG